MHGLEVYMYMPDLPPALATDNIAILQVQVN